MTRHSFGPRLGDIVQCAYLVEDLERAMRDWSDVMGIGPWVVAGPFEPIEGLYRGEPTEACFSLAITFSAGMMIELIQQHDELPSVYQEIRARRGYGFHHWARCTEDIDRTAQDYVDKGFDICFSTVSPRGARIVYIDTSHVLSGMTELIQWSPGLERVYGDWHAAAQNWDGRSLRY